MVEGERRKIVRSVSLFWSTGVRIGASELVWRENSLGRRRESSQDLDLAWSVAYLMHTYRTELYQCEVASHSAKSGFHG